MVHTIEVQEQVHNGTRRALCSGYLTLALILTCFHDREKNRKNHDNFISGKSLQSKDEFSVIDCIHLNVLDGNPP